MTEKTYVNETLLMIPLTFIGGETYFLLPRQEVRSDLQPLKLDERVTVKEDAAPGKSSVESSSQQGKKRHFKELV